VGRGWPVHTERRLRLVHFNVLGNHAHLICEAADEKSRSRGMQGLETRMAKALNRVMQRHRGVFDGRYRGHILRTPTEVKHALHYVRENDHQHFGRPGHAFSSLAHPELIVPAKTWLLRAAPP